MHAWLSLETFAASFATSEGFCAGAAVAKEKRRNPRTVAEWRLLIAPPGLPCANTRIAKPFNGGIITSNSTDPSHFEIAGCKRISRHLSGDAARHQGSIQS